MATLTRADTEYKFDAHFLPFLQNVPFFAEMSRHMRKIPTFDLPTAGVTYDVASDDICLYYNPKFMQELEAHDNGDAEIHGLLTHEFYHLVFRHLAARRKTPHGMWNIATDAAINCLIMFNEDGTDNRTGALPPGGILPGKPVVEFMTGRTLTKEEKEGKPLTKLIESWPKMKASEWYFSSLQKLADEQEKNCPVHGKGAKGDKKDKGAGGGGMGEKGEEKGKGDQPGEGDGDQPGDGKGGPGNNDGCTCGRGEGAGGLGPMDSHDIWDDVGDTNRDYIDARLSDLVSKAVKHADTRANGWGNMHAGLRSEIRASIEHEVDWRQELRSWVGTTVRGDRVTSIKRINKRYPYLFPGTKRTYRPKLLVIRDMSGSVGDDAIELFFGEINAMTRLVDIDVMNFDTSVSEIFPWKKGRGAPKTVCVRDRCGGTDFEAPTQVVNDPKNRGRWDGVVFLTDGECGKPSATRIRRLWVICPGRKMLFAPDAKDKVIELKKDAPKRGAWR